MGDVIFDLIGDPTTSKPTNGEEVLGMPAAGNQKADVIPPPAPKKGTTREKPLCSNDLPADGDGINTTLAAAI